MPHSAGKICAKGRNGINEVELKKRLEAVLANCPIHQRAALDPVSFPRRFLLEGRSRQEIELAALISAMLSYGRLELFTKVIQEIFERADNQILEVALGQRQFHGEWPKYRLSTGSDIARLVHAAGQVIKLRGGMWESFNRGWISTQTLRDGLIALHEDLISATETDEYGHITHGSMHLLPDPKRGGPVKRWLMFTRWMVRPNDGVDLGLWPQVPTSELVIPLDRHISQLSRHLGLTNRTSDDWKTAVEITANLRRICPEDPVKYDFALCHLGISGHCTHGRNQDICKICSLNGICKV